MNKRLLQKKKTRELIYQTARDEFIKHGFLQTTTAQIAKKAKVAQGTLFLHFSNKNVMIEEVLDKELDIISNRIYQLAQENSDLKTLLSQYLDMVSEKEDFFVVITREFPFYEKKIKRKILFKESVIREHFYNLILSQYKMDDKEEDIPIYITMLFSTIKYYLIMKDMLVKEGSVLQKYKSKISSSFLRLLK